MAGFDAVVIGNGLFGSAAARHLSGFGARVLTIGPDEPAEPTTPGGVYSSHYDEGRLTRLVDRDHTWAWVTRRAVANYSALEDASRIRFHHPVGALIVGLRGRSASHVEDPIKMVQECGIPHDLYEPGDRSWRSRFPHLDFPETHYVLHEPAPAGFINPRRLIEAQNAVALEQGVEIVRETATAVEATATGMAVTTDTGATYRAAKVLVAAGAFSNFNNLLPRALPLSLKTEVVALAEVAASDWERLRDVPTVKYVLESPVLEGLYMIPPVRYPDGGLYIKVGANSTFDQYPTTLAQLNAWFSGGSGDVCLPAYEEVLGQMWPGTEFLGVQIKRCVVCYTPSNNPIIDQLDDALFVVTAGNGGGAKASDAWGELAAGLVHDGRWPDELPRLGC